MPVRTHAFSLQMEGDTHIKNITNEIREALQKTSLHAGIVTVFVKHTTASVLIIEDEPGIRADTKTIWEHLIPQDPAWQHNVRNHGEDNGHSHLRGQIQGCSVTIPFNDQTLHLGSWQEIVILDFDTRARVREVIVQIIGE